MSNREKLATIYQNRFSGHESYRNNVWSILISKFFTKWLKTDYNILDLGCGYGEFINQVDSKAKYAMDLNPNTKKILNDDIIFHEQDCSQPWNIESESLDLVFTSNFFEHLPNKFSLDKTIAEIRKALKPRGFLIAMGPNISVLNGKYWDFWDHHVALSDSSLSELLEINDFKIIRSYSRFLPYNMVRVKERPLFLISLYLRLPIFWSFFGKQFLIIAQK